ncbi:unnamed protein product [Cercospora beticola]|nr:unnamed protein product [Cercospora beticola]
MASKAAQSHWIGNVMKVSAKRSVVHPLQLLQIGSNGHYFPRDAIQTGTFFFDLRTVVARSQTEDRRHRKIAVWTEQTFLEHSPASSAFNSSGVPTRQRHEGSEPLWAGASPCGRE